MKRVLPIFLLLLLTVTSCRKDPVIVKKKIPPKEFFPACPGSWWEYTNQYGDTRTMSVKDTWAVHNDSLLLPQIDKGFGRLANDNLIYGYFKVRQNTSAKYRFMSDTISFWLSDIYYDPELQMNERTVTVDTSILVNNLMYEHCVCNDHYAEPFIPFRDTSFYCKGIGLTKFISLRPDNYPNQDTVYWELTDYYLANCN